MNEDLYKEVTAHADELPFELDQFTIAQLWTLDEDRRSEIEDDLLTAIVSGKLRGSIFVRNPNYETGFREIPSNRWLHIRNGWFGNGWVLCVINRGDLKKWIVEEGKFVSDNSAINKWIHSLNTKKKDSSNINPKLVKRRNDWIDCMEYIANKLKVRDGTYPNQTKLWNELLESPPEQFSVEVVNQKNRSAYLRIGDKKMDYKSFKSRFNTIFEAN